MAADMRVWIENIGRTMQRLEESGCVCKGTYLFKDHLYFPKHQKFDLDLEFVRIRVHDEPQGNRKPVEVTHKVKHALGVAGELVFKQEFDRFEDAHQPIRNSHELAFSATYNGVEYLDGAGRILLEEIDYIPPTAEVWAPTQDEALSVLEKLNHQGFVACSVLHLVAEALGKLERREYGAERQP